MKKCEICGKLVEDDEIIEFSVLPEEGDEPISKIFLCKDCSEPLKRLTQEDFNNIFKEFINNLEENWEKGTIENSIPGKIVKIMSLKGEEDHYLFGKTGVIEKIDDIGQLHGTWGSLAIIPTEDSYLVYKEGINAK